MTVEVTIVGDWEHADFAALGCGPQSYARHATVASALASPARHLATVVVLLQPRPTAVSQRGADALREAFRQAVPVLVYGSLCEGECRSGRPITGWNRVPWYRWNAEFERFRAGDTAVWGASPGADVAAPVAERLRWSAGGRCRSVALIGRSSTRLAMFRDALQQLGHDPRAWTASAGEPGCSPPPVSAAFIAGDSLDPWLAGWVDRLRRYRRLDALVVAVNFPRAYETTWLQRRGGDRLRVIAQPFELFQLQAALAGTSAAGAANLDSDQRRTA